MIVSTTTRRSYLEHDGVVDGAYDLRFEVTDEATPPNVSIGGPRIKIVDTTADGLQVGSPPNGAVVSGGVTLGVSANDDNLIKQVEYFKFAAAPRESPRRRRSRAPNLAAAGDGPAQIYAVVEDMAGNSTTTNTITVTATTSRPL